MTSDRIRLSHIRQKYQAHAPTDEEHKKKDDALYFRPRPNATGINTGAHRNTGGTANHINTSTKDNKGRADESAQEHDLRYAFFPHQVPSRGDRNAAAPHRHDVRSYRLTEEKPPPLAVRVGLVLSGGSIHPRNQGSFSPCEDHGVIYDNRGAAARAAVVPSPKQQPHHLGPQSHGGWRRERRNGQGCGSMKQAFGERQGQSGVGANSQGKIGTLVSGQLCLCSFRRVGIDHGNIESR